MVYWNTEDVIAALIGGVIIAISTSLNLYVYGKITGLSGILGSVMKYDKEQGFYWKFSFVLGLLTVPFAIYYLVGDSIEIQGEPYYLFDSPAYAQGRLSLGGWILGGILVGVGTRVGNGCTSGHGVCGIPRFAKRSIVATCTFIAAGMAFATIRYYFPFLEGTENFDPENEEPEFNTLTFTFYWFLVLLFFFFLYKVLSANVERPAHVDYQQYLFGYLIGLIFGTGLLVSGMTRITKIIGFLTISSEWDPTLIFVMVSAIGVNVVTFWLMMRGHRTPVKSREFKLPTNNVIDLKLVSGAAIFGLGWGLSGLCPGPGMINFFVLDETIAWMAGFVVGQLAWQKAEEKEIKVQAMALNNT